MAEVTEWVRDFEPSYPFYIVFADGSPITGSDEAMTFIVGCSSQELGELVAKQFKEEHAGVKMALLPVEDAEEFSVVAANLIEQGVTHMAWNATGNSTTILVTALADFAESATEG
jgi:hypothetical protein